MKITERAERLRGAQLASLAFALVLLAVDGTVAGESWHGLTGFATLIGITGIATYGVPVTLDGVSVASALLALRAELGGESSGAYRFTMYGATLASVAANWWHARVTGDIEAALYFGGMSLGVTWLFSLVLRQLRREDRRRAGRITEQLPRFSGAHWLRFPRLTFRAWSLAVLRGYTSPREALDAAALAAEPAELPEVPPPAELAAMPKADAIRIALAHSDGNVIRAMSWLKAHGLPVPNRSYVHDVKRGVSGHRRGRRELTAGADGAAA